jgi:hypothetical protein
MIDQFLCLQQASIVIEKFSLGAVYYLVENVRVYDVSMAGFVSVFT